jgi:hypothetical protein
MTYSCGTQVAEPLQEFCMLGITLTSALDNDNLK